MAWLPMMATAAAPRRIGVISGSLPESEVGRMIRATLEQALARYGYVEGKNVQMVWRFAGGDYGRIAAFADELVAMPVDVLVVTSAKAAAEAKRATRTIPIVLTGASDVVRNKLVINLAHPEANVTGVADVDDSFLLKRLECLRAALSGLARLGVLINPTNGAGPAALKVLRDGAPGLGVQVTAAYASSVPAFETAFASLARERIQALIVCDDAFFMNQRGVIAALALRQRWPSIGSSREYAEGGLLMSYGERFQAQIEQAVGYVDKLLRGARPGDLPVTLPREVPLTVNRKTALALGLALTPEILLRADEVIE